MLKGIKEFIKDPAGAIALIFVGAIGGFAGVLSYGIHQMNPEKPDQAVVDQLTRDILNTEISAEELRSRGYFTRGNSSQFLDECRNQYLTSEFSQHATPQELAQAITDCVYDKAAAQYQETSEGALSALATYNTTPVKIADGVVHGVVDQAQHAGKIIGDTLQSAAGHSTPEKENGEQLQSRPPRQEPGLLPGTP